MGYKGDFSTLGWEGQVQSRKNDPGMTVFIDIKTLKSEEENRKENTQPFKVCKYMGGALQAPRKFSKTWNFFNC